MNIAMSRITVAVISGAALALLVIQSADRAGNGVHSRNEAARSSQVAPSIAGHSYGDVINGLTVGGR